MANKVVAFQVRGSTYGVDPDLTFDTTPTQGSANPVTSNGIALAVQGAAVGTNISVGRTSDTAIGYCSIAYGRNNTATGESSIVFGRNNVCASPWSFISGMSSKSMGKMHIMSGDTNSTYGRQTALFGNDLHAGTMINPISESTFPRYDEPKPSCNKVYTGYIDVNSKIVSYTYDANNHCPNNDTQIDIDLPTSGYNVCYVVDKTNDSDYRPSQNPGDIYKITNTYQGKTIVKITNNAYVRFTDVCSHISYSYGGTCYYDTQNDVAYTDAARTQTLNPLTNRTIYYDIDGDSFILRPGNATPIRQYRNWIKKKVYYGRGVGYITYKWGRYAYIYPNSGEEVEKRWHVYASESFDPLTDITDQLYDGELIFDYLTGEAYFYIFDVNHNLYATGDPGGGYDEAPYPVGALMVGSNNYSTANYGSICAGYGNHVNRFSYGSVVFGYANTVDIGGSGLGNAYGICCGRDNTIKSRLWNNQSIFYINGYANNVEYYDQNDSNLPFVTGKSNKIKGQASELSFATGYNNTIFSSSNTHSIGTYNTCRNLNESCVFGASNEIGYFNNKSQILELHVQDDGKYKVGNTSTIIDPNHNPSYRTDVLYVMLKLPDPGPQEHRDYTSEDFAGYYISTDGTSLTSVNVARSSYVSILGYGNHLYKDANGYSNYNVIIGNNCNVNMGSGNHGAMLFGHNLEADISSGTGVSGYTVIGCYNSTSGITGAKFIAGIGNSSTRKNGLVIFDSGVNAAPSSPDSISAAVTAMSTTGLSSDKMLITYAQLRDYTGPGGGGSSRPSVTTVTLLSSDWTGFDQMVPLSGVDENSIVIVQPAGSPIAYNTNNIYLSDQGEDSLTFTCGTLPSSDITVKVVYWV